MLRKYISTKDESARVFRSDILEMLSKNHFSIPLMIYVPVILYLLFKGLSGIELSLFSMVIYFSSGLVVWTFTEYVLHRFVFHYQPTSNWGKRLHFLMHGIHHDYPNDSKRLVMPPTLSIPMATLFFLVFSLVFNGESLFLFFAGFLLGYLSYDMMHFAIHHFHWNHPKWQQIKNHHMIHHYVDESKGFGVSSKLWDFIFNTLIEPHDGNKLSER